MADLKVKSNSSKASVLRSQRMLIENICKFSLSCKVISQHLDIKAEAEIECIKQIE